MHILRMMISGIDYDALLSLIQTPQKTGVLGESSENDARYFPAAEESKGCSKNDRK